MLVFLPPMVFIFLPPMVFIFLPPMVNDPTYYYLLNKQTLNWQQRLY
ncbi:unnamed protein product [Ectocarpus sp. 6 AP-2014]